jgi:hypothetical protein
MTIVLNQIPYDFIVNTDKNGLCVEEIMINGGRFTSEEKILKLIDKANDLYPDLHLLR